MATVNLTDFRRLFEEETKDQLLDIIGNFMVKRTREHFLKQEFDGKPWKARYSGIPKSRRISIAGVIKDLTRSSDVKGRRLQDRPALVDTGILRDSIAFESVGNTVRIGTVVPYAKTHQLGLQPEAIPVTKQVKKRLAGFLKKNERFGDTLGFIFQEDFTSYQPKNVFKRPFLGITADDTKEILEIVDKFIEDL